MALSSPVSPRDLGLKEKRFQSIEELGAAYNIMVERLNEVYKFNRRDHVRLTEDIADADAAGFVGCRAMPDGGNPPQTVPNGLTATKVVLEKYENYFGAFDPGDMFDVGNSQIIIPSDGYYLVLAQAAFTTTEADVAHNLQIFSSAAPGMSRAFVQKFSSYTSIAMAVDEVLVLNEGDAVYMKVAHNSAGGNATLSSARDTCLTVIKQ